MTDRIVCLAIILSMLSCPGLAKNTLDLGSVQTPAKALGMGRACTSIAINSGSIFTNVAGLAYSKSFSFNSMSTRVLDKVNYLMLSASSPTQWGTFGGGLLSASSPAGYYTTSHDDLSNAQPMYYNDYSLLFSWARKMSDFFPDIENHLRMRNISIGTSLKYYSKSFSGNMISGYVGSGFDADMGIMFEPTDKSSVGIFAQNVVPASMGAKIRWDSLEEEGIPMVFKAGASIKTLGDKLTAALDAYLERAEHSPLTFHLGAEYMASPYFFIRAGIDQDKNVNDTNSGWTIASKLTLGLGLRLRDFDFDFAYVQDPNFSQNNLSYFSVSFLKPKTEEPSGTGLLPEPAKDLSTLGLDENLKKLIRVQKQIEAKRAKDKKINTLNLPDSEASGVADQNLLKIKKTEESTDAKDKTKKK